MNDLSIDIGGTKIRVVLYDNDFHSLKEDIYDTKKFFRAKGITDLKKLLLKIQNGYGDKFKKIGVSFNCPIKNNRIFYSSLLGGKIDIYLPALFEKYFSFSEFSSENDVFCMTKAEMVFGVAKDMKNMLFVNLGTGIRVVGTNDGKLIRGDRNLAGEISQDPNWVDELKKYLTTDFLPSGQGIGILSKEIYGKKLSALEVFKKNDQKLIDLFTKYLAIVISRACYFYNPSTIIFAGSIVKSENKWLNKFKKQYFRYCHPLFTTKNIYISKVEHPASLGALLD